MMMFAATEKFKTVRLSTDGAYTKHWKLAVLRFPTNTITWLGTATSLFLCGRRCICHETLHYENVTLQRSTSTLLNIQ
jgi:hypothetical protein